MASVANFKDRFKEFKNIDSIRVQFALDDAALIMSSPAKWLSFYDVAQLYHAAHLLVVSVHTERGDSGTLAPIKHQEVDDVVIKSAVGDIDPTFDDMYSTSYGKRYIAYRRRCFLGLVGV
tara:strand:- start:4738 stop:5097 length:360 start_codon:yes stop_codon:yes gene_type:complete